MFEVDSAANFILFSRVLVNQGEWPDLGIFRQKIELIDLLFDGLPFFRSKVAFSRILLQEDVNFSTDFFDSIVIDWNKRRNRYFFLVLDIFVEDQEGKFVLFDLQLRAQPMGKLLRRLSDGVKVVVTNRQAIVCLFAFESANGALQWL